MVIGGGGIYMPLWSSASFSLWPLKGVHLCVEFKMAGLPINARLQLIMAELQEQQELEGLLFMMLVLRRRDLKRRRHWVKPWIQRRAFYGDYENLIMVELEIEARGDFVGYLRMPPATFNELVDRLSTRLTKTTTSFA